jgi:chromosomal replication initiator protein
MTRAAWKEILEDLRLKIPEQQYQTWFAQLRYVAREGSLLLVATPHRFYKEWIEENYLDQIEDSARKILGGEVAVEVVADSPPEGEEGVPPPGTPPGDEGAPPPEGTVPQRVESAPTHTRHQSASGLDPRYTFDRFVVGAGNQFAHAAAVAVANDPGRNYNPLFLYAGVGLGKTHLLHAIGNHFVAASPQAKVCYISSEKFLNDIVQGIRTNRQVEFRERYRNVDMLLVDDIQFIAGKAGTQEEFFHTFNTLFFANKQIVVTSDKFPNEIEGLEERIQSRFACGLVADIQPPDLETKAAILMRRAEADGIPLPPEVAHFLSTSIKTTNIRDLEGSLIRVGAFASLTGRRVDLPLAREVLSHLMDSGRREIAPDTIIKAVADHFGVKLSEIKSDRKHRVVALPRQVAMFLLRELTPCSFPDIGQRFGGRDHTTVMYAVKKIEQALPGDGELRNAVEAIRKGLEG